MLKCPNLNFSPSFGVLTRQYVPAVPQPDAKDRLSDDARVVSNRRRYLLEVDLRISNHSERPFCVPNFDVRSTNSSSDHSRSVTLERRIGEPLFLKGRRP